LTVTETCVTGASFCPFWGLVVGDGQAAGV
jgi:hypothetical protein